MIKILKLFSFLLLSSVVSLQDGAAQVVRIPCSDADATTSIREAIEAAAYQDEIIIELEEGTYLLNPDLAFEKYAPITNHGNGLKKIAFPISGYKKVVIEGNGAKLIFHGQMMPFLFEDCENIEVRNLTINWDIPFTFLAEVVATSSEEGWREVKPRGADDGFSWRLSKGEILFPDVDGFSYSHLGSTLAFDAQTKRPIEGVLDLHSEPTRVEQLENGNLMIYEKLRQMPPVGSLLSSKGDRANDRYAPAFDFKECSNIVLEGVTIHHALGMGFLFERSEDITIKGCSVCLEKGSERVISSTADATHFANCRGDILVEECLFENMMDDGTNVHGTYVKVRDIVDSNTLRVEFHHFEQLGFKFADVGDDMWFLLQPSPERKAEGRVKSVKVINEEITEISFEEALPEAITKGDVLENKTWNPTFTMRGCTIQNHRARSIVLKSPLKTVIENNYFSSMMSGVLLRGEMKVWYESGGVTDLLIQGNTFENGADCGTTHAALYITPLFGSNFDSSAIYDKNIRFISNTIRNSNPRVIIADRVSGLTIEDNIIELTDDYQAPFPNAPLFELINSEDVTISNNSYSGATPKNLLEIDEKSQSTFKSKNNKGFKL
ncbi:MAG: right-handed parallel beta-helix repeat-containing protein [Rikenellaceae bacterium]